MQAFVEPTDENDVDRRLVDRLRARERPRRHARLRPALPALDGQLHKGGPNTGLFLQVVDDPGDELAIPGKPFGFRRLIRAQAAGDSSR